MSQVSANWKQNASKPASNALITVKGYSISFNKSGGLFFRHPDGMAFSQNVNLKAGLALLEALGVDSKQLQAIFMQGVEIKQKIESQAPTQAAWKN
jgi:hypothetical protein